MASADEVPTTSWRRIPGQEVEGEGPLPEEAGTSSAAPLQRVAALEGEPEEGEPEREGPVLAPAVEGALTALAHATGAVSFGEMLTVHRRGERGEARRARREELYLRLVPVSGTKLEAAFRALVAASVASWAGRGEPAVKSPGLACRVAEDLAVEVDEWEPVAGYFDQYPREELVEVAEGVGVEGAAGLSSEELVRELAESDALSETYRPPELAFWDGRDEPGEGVSS